MLKALIIGDVHAKVEDLADCELLLNVIKDVESRERPDVIIFEGDLYDAFALKNVIVERWWMEAIDRLEAPGGKYLIVGNHDRPGDSSAVGHALQAHARQSNTYIVNCPTRIFEGVGALPFYFKAEDFLAATRCIAFGDVKTVICHQSFIGGKYESGQPIEAKHDVSAVDAAAVSQKCIIAGHIHTPQHVGKVLYTGSPRWRNNVSDSLPGTNERHIYVVDFEIGLPMAIRKYPTGDCRRIWKLDMVEGKSHNMEQLPGKDGDRYVIDVTGSAAFIETAKSDLSRPGIRLRAFQTDRPGPKLSEAAGVSAAWGSWASEYRPRFGTSTEKLATMARERLGL